MEQDKKQKPELAEEQLKEVGGGFTQVCQSSRVLKLYRIQRKAAAQR